MKSFIKKILRSVKPFIAHRFAGVAGSNQRPIGNIQLFLEDVRARQLSPAFILDVGAHRGEWTRMAKAIFPQASFLLIEPQIEMRSDLEALCAQFEDITWVEAGAGSQSGTLVQTIWKDLAGSSFLPAVNDALLEAGQQRDVPIITIDSLLESRHVPIPDLVKLDIQGFELEALRGATSLFGHTELFILEVNLFTFMPEMPLLHEVIAFMAERGYNVYDIPGYLRRPRDGALGQIDLAFAKRDGVLRQSHQWS